MTINRLVKSIPCMTMRGGTSKGAFFLKSDLPEKWEDKEKVLAKIMNPLTGLGGSTPTVNKVAIISPFHDKSTADINYFSGQVKSNKVDTGISCGNTLAAVGPFAIENGLVQADNPETRVRIFCENSGVIVHATVQTPEGKITYEGNTVLDGVPGKWAPLTLNYINASGAKTGKLFPSGKLQEVINHVRATWIDLAVPTLLLNANDLGLKGTESPEQLTKNSIVFEKLHKIIDLATASINLSDKSMIRVSIISAPINGGTITSRCFTTEPLTAHATHPVQVALSITAACSISGTTATELASNKLAQKIPRVIIEHPQGNVETTICLEKNINGEINVPEVGIISTANLIMKGTVQIYI